MKENLYKTRVIVASTQVRLLFTRMPCLGVPEHTTERTFVKLTNGAAIAKQDSSLSGSCRRV
jgi:hypothetical protein